MFKPGDYVRVYGKVVEVIQSEKEVLYKVAVKTPSIMYGSVIVVEEELEAESTVARVDENV